MLRVALRALRCMQQVDQERIVRSCLLQYDIQLCCAVAAHGDGLLPDRVPEHLLGRGRTLVPRHPGAQHLRHTQLRGEQSSLSSIAPVERVMDAALGSRFSCSSPDCSHERGSSNKSIDWPDLTRSGGWRSGDQLHDVAERGQEWPGPVELHAAAHQQGPGDDLC